MGLLFTGKQSCFVFGQVHTNHGLEAGYTDGGLWWFSESLKGNVGKLHQTGHNNLFPRFKINYLPINRPLDIIQSYNLMY
jgi:hypothetical protein